MHRTTIRLNLLKQIYILWELRYETEQNEIDEVGAKNKNRLRDCPEKDNAEVICYALFSGAFVAV